MAGRKALNRLIKQLLDKHDKDIEAVFLAAVQGRVDGISFRDLERAIEARDFDRVITIVGLSRADLFALDTAIMAAFVEGGQTVSMAAPAFAVAFGFDGRATGAATWARDHVGGLVTNIIADQRDAIREVVSKQVFDGIGPRKAAIQIAGRVTPKGRVGGIVGLSKPQASYLMNARAELEGLNSAYFGRKLRDRRFDGLVKRAVAAGKPLSAVDVDRITQRYSDRMLKHRADTIARTESIAALRAGRREGIEQAIEQGAIGGRAIKRVWSATLDSRTRPDHVAMDNKAVNGMDAPFVLPDGSMMRYPGDTSMGASAAQTIACRCYDEYVVDWLTR
ncbi:phage minor head protein [Parasphingorhabdus sp. JC815]|uniref:phage minor head protein n=1 Tax=Parasphingorhabdus sp. JC815 TaxID=3232140 RepID=UPI00345A0130